MIGSMCAFGHVDMSTGVWVYKHRHGNGHGHRDKQASGISKYLATHRNTHLPCFFIANECMEPVRKCGLHRSDIDWKQYLPLYVPHHSVPLHVEMGNNDQFALGAIRVTFFSLCWDTGVYHTATH